MIKWYKLVFGSLLTITNVPFFINETHQLNKIFECNDTVEDNDYLQINHTNANVFQRLLIDKTYDDKKEHTKTVSFDNAIKKIYLSPDNKNVDAKKLLISCKQTTNPTNPNSDYGYFQYDINQKEIKKDLNERIENWNDVYFNNLSCDPDKIGTNFGFFLLNLRIKNSVFWPTNKLLSELDVPCGFRNQNHERCIYGRASDAEFNENVLQNKNDPIKGVPFLYIKEEGITGKGCKFKEHLITYWIKGINFSQFDILDLQYKDISQLLASNYDLTNLVDITGASFNNKTIHLSLNQDFVNRAKQLDEYHQTLKNKLQNDWNEIHKLKPDFEKKLFNNLIDMNILSDGNVQYLKLYLSPPCTGNMHHMFDIYSFMRLFQPKNLHEYVKSLGFNELDNPWAIIHDLNSKMKLSFNYAINNQQQPAQWIAQTCNFNFGELQNGVDILIGRKGNDVCKFRFDSLVSNELNTNDTYIGQQTINKINCNTNLINSIGENTYEINQPKITKVEFKNNDVFFNRNYFVNDISNNQILKEYVSFITNFQEIADWSILSRDQYEIIRNPQAGTIKIIINLDDQNYEQTFVGFKVSEAVFKDIDASIVVNNLVIDDLDDQKISQLLQYNGFDQSITDGLHFSIKDSDNHKGTATICIEQCKQIDLVDAYLNKTFKIFNLRPYFIEQNKKVNFSKIAKKPSQVSEEEFKNELVNMSEEFINRHSNDLLISLKPNDAKGILVANLTFNDIKSQNNVNLTFTYNLNKKNINWAIIISATGVFVIGLILLGIYLWRKIRKPKLQQLTKQL